MARTAGHTLSVVECLRALAAGDPGVPATLAEAVLARVDRLEPEVRDVLRGRGGAGPAAGPAAAGHARRVDRAGGGPALRGAGPGAAAAWSATAATTSSTTWSRSACTRPSTGPVRGVPPAGGRPDRRPAGADGRARLRRGRCRPRRARLAAGGRGGHAARGRRRCARAVRPGRVRGGGSSLRARLLIERARPTRPSTAFAAALDGHRRGARLARAGPDRRLEMTALRARGGDVPVALRRPLAEIADHLDAGLGLAADLGDRRAEAALHHPAHHPRGEPAAADRRARARGARAGSGAGRSGRRTPWCWLSTASRRSSATSGTPNGCATSWPSSSRALRRGEQPGCCSGRCSTRPSWRPRRATGRLRGRGSRRRWTQPAQRLPGVRRLLHAHVGWFDRLAGDLDGALRHGRGALALTSPVDHPWWYATAAGFLSSTLLELGRARTRP